MSLQVTVPESNQPPNFLWKWEKGNFVCWLNTTFCVGKPFRKPRPSSINIIRTLLHRMEQFRSGLPNFVVVVRAQKPYQVQVIQISIFFCIHNCAWKFCARSERIFASICDDRWNIDPPLYSDITWRVKTVDWRSYSPTNLVKTGLNTQVDYSSTWSGNV